MSTKTAETETSWHAQQPYILAVRQYFEQRQRAPLAYVRTYGCQQNVSDSERLKGMLAQMGFGFTSDFEQADLLLFNTCAVRENAENRVFGNVGALKALKRRRPSVLIALCGCMVQQEHIVEKLRESYPFVGLIFGTHMLPAFPKLLSKALIERTRVVESPASDGTVTEDIPVMRDGTFQAFVPIMYGCNNFCTYCVVPYVRGRERSREPDRILEEVRQLAGAGYKEITLLGQNVNSYGKGRKDGMDFPALLREIDRMDGEFLIRFMTSHPKDATDEMFRVIAQSQNISHHIHLPFQSGSDQVLKAMNRGYTRQGYLDLIARARDILPDVTFSSDVIVGFPGETREDFEDTLSLMKEVGFSSLFTFIYSPREGTPAAKRPDPIPSEEKTAWFLELTALQQEISAARLAKMVGRRVTVLIEGGENGALEGRMEDNGIVRLEGSPELMGRRAQVEITQARPLVVLGKILHILD